MPTEHETRERERVAWLKGFRKGQDSPYKTLVADYIDHEYPLPSPPVKVWECQGCGAIVNDLILLADGCPGNVTYWHRGSGNIAYCGPVEEVDNAG